ncbi:MAG: acetoacetate decarboxylase family protein [Bacteroidota bacterium]
MAELVAAPWNLTGDGYIMSFKFPANFIDGNCFLSAEQKKAYAGGTGCIMLANYQSSNVGPYSELLFIPGKFNYHRKKLYTVSKIYVSTEASLRNGRNNWGLPKELATFSFTKDGNNIEKIKITHEGAPIMDIVIQASGLPLPVNTCLTPYPLIQEWDGKTYFINFKGRGTGRFGQILKVDVNQKYFPNFAFFKHVAIIKVSNFKLTFPPANISPGTAWA